MAASFFLTILLLVSMTLSLSIERRSLHTEGLEHPNGLSTVTPTLSWRLTGSSRGESQAAFQVQAASSVEALKSPDLWDTGKVSGANISVQYAGAAVTSRSIVWWRVRTWSSDDDAVSAWSGITTFEIGLLESSDWSAQWITNPTYELGTTSLPLFSKTFEVNCSVIQARAYALGLGVQSVHINGNELTEEVLAPGYSNYNKRLLYTTYNISTYLTTGTNSIGIELGRGLWDTQKAIGGRYQKITTSGQSLNLIAQLEYTCADGTVYTVASDDSWKTSVDGPLRESSWYGGEEYDATRELTGWSNPSQNVTDDWDLATITTGPSGQLQGPRYPALKIVESIQAVNVTGPVDGQWIIDFGVNFAGWFSLKIDESAGTRVTTWPCERLKSNGGLDQSTTGSPIYDAFTSAGVAQTYSPKFMYHGFRYLAVNTTSAPTVADAVGLVIRTGAESVGSFDSSESMLNSIHRITDRAIQSNLFSVMTDCPHREKLGWLEQTHLVFQPVTRNYDSLALGNGIVATMLDAQTDDGLVPDIAPEYVVFSEGFRDDPNWGNALVLMPLMLYQQYGFASILEESYDAMAAYVAFLAAKTSNNTLAYGLGDWITFDDSTPLGITATFGYYQALQAIQQIATILGNTSDAEKYGATIKAVQEAFASDFLTITDDGAYTYGSGSQASNAIALDMGVVPVEQQSAVAQKIADSIIENGNHLTVGEIALPSLFRALQSLGLNDVVYDMMTVPTAPSYAYQVLQGATSLTERWDGPTASCSGCNSLNHFMLGYADQWLLELSGLSQAENSSAWESIQYSPFFVTNLTSASSSYRSVRGVASASWVLAGGQLTYDIVVPVGATGSVTLNMTALGFSILQENGTVLSETSIGNGIEGYSVTDGTASVQVGPGSMRLLRTRYLKTQKAGFNAIG